MTNEEIVARIQSGASSTELLEVLYIQNIGIINIICRKLSVKSGVDIEDLTQEAYFGLVKATMSYDTALNVKFLSVTRGKP